ncbi:multidrug efflux SMR transporter [Komarekiella sp. 'clone 1']|uniref:Multidrug efflux SMR transporter n=1 Tax=Komarekiella delphini-convector SJRDD-AB1 TaxID=2593771 RepID=A0AA40VS89_9NOST|nr:multidrug efflux SMR transporter [Komarekiella delphini-convector]MBD6617116.1 multidrug efflux SMR transporter [Komarekiella delphini-convector SJRDD-AB1]
MAWIHILIAGLLETTWAVTLKWSNGFTNFLPTAATTVVTILSFYFLSQALKTLPVGTTYAVLAGIGAIGTVIADIVFFGESYGLFRSLCIGLIVLGVMGLRIL